MKKLATLFVTPTSPKCVFIISYNGLSASKGGRKVGGVVVMKDKELKLEDI